MTSGPAQSVMGDDGPPRPGEPVADQSAEEPGSRGEPTRPGDAPGSALALEEMSGRAAQQRIARLDTTPRAPSQARSLVTGALRSWSVPEATVSNVEIAVSELVSNAVEHGVGQIDLELDLAGARLLLRVRDGEASAPVRRTVDEQAVRGRGLLIVEALSTSWGHHADGDGKWVWAEFALPDEPPDDADPAE